jgi:hypothetical protein
MYGPGPLSVDLYNNYSGVMRFGPSYTIIGPHPPQIPHDAGVYDPNLVVTGVPSLDIGFV